jgi:glucan 1,3-beta-glucosidase
MWNHLSDNLSSTPVPTTAHRVSVFDHGVYLVTKTIFVPAGAQIVGDMFPTILASGVAFQDQTKPTPVLKVWKQHV